MSKAVAESDVVITTASVPGRKAPVLVSEDMVKGMRPGSVIVDLPAGPVNLPGMVPFHASQMYSSNITSFFLHMVKQGGLNLDLQDEITRETLVARGGEVVHPRVREALGLTKDAPAERSS